MSLDLYLEFFFSYFLYLKGLHCQETNQEFVPFPKQRNNQVFGEDKNDDKGYDSDQSSMSDLYPGKNKII